jgi:hypothetical protein
MGPMPSERYCPKLLTEPWITTFTCIDYFLLNFKVHRIINLIEHFKNKNVHGPDLPETGRNGQIRPRSASTHAGEEFQMADRRGPVVSGSRIPNRYRPISAVRLSADRRLVFVVFAIEKQRGGEARVWSGSTGGSPRVVHRRSGGGVWLRWVGRAWRCCWRGERRCDGVLTCSLHPQMLQ